MGTKNAMTPEMALTEVEKWLDYKRVKAKEREKQQAQIDVLVDGFIDGSLSLDKDNNIIQKLSFDFEGTKEAKYKPRLTVGEINAKLKGVDALSADERLVAYVSASTGAPMGIIKRFDMSDYKVAQAIAMFFL